MKITFFPRVTKTVKNSVADPGFRCLFDPGDPEWVKNQDSDPG
jgi:hypothetical protein